MSRLIIKNLPSNCTEDQLRKFFKSYGELTDCTLKYTKEGKFRKFAFVGFETEAAANKAQNKADQSFMGSAKLQVEECKPFGDNNKPRAWSQYAKDSSAYKRKHGTGEGTSNKKDETTSEQPMSKKAKKTDLEFDKFLEAKGVTKNVKKSTVVSSPTDSQLLAELLEGVQGDTKLSLIFTGLPSALKPNNLKEWLAPVRIKAMKVSRNSETAAAFVSFNRPPDVRRALQRSGEFLGGFKVEINKVEQESEPMEAEETETKDEMKERAKTEEARLRDDILETGRLFLRNLPFTCKEEHIVSAMRRYGEVADVRVIVDKSTGKCKGFAIVEFVFPENALTAYAAMDGKVFRGRMLHILAGAEKRETKKEEGSGGEGEDGEKEKEKDTKTSYKKDKLEKLKAGAQKQVHSWNALFLGANAVAETVAERLGVSKSSLLMDEGGESAGVRLALAETRLVRETRDFLQKNGVCLDAFSRPAAKRSDEVILAKNLPAGVESDELMRMFERFGEVKKVLIPPEGGVSAIIVMGSSVEAKKAFKMLAYSRFRTQPLFLEWAPGDVFGEPKPEKIKKKKETKEVVTEAEEIEEVTEKKKNKRDMTYEERVAERKQKQKGEIHAEEKDEDKEQVEEESFEAQEGYPAGKEITEEYPAQDEEPEEGSTVFVKNLAFSTTDEALGAFFRSDYRIQSAKVSRKLNPSDQNKSLSMGFGFVQFYSQKEANDAIRKLQGSLLDGHCVELKQSHRELPEIGGLKRKKSEAKAQGKCTKILVKNLPFQAKLKEVESLFTTFGEVKNIRVPRKMGSKDQHRGFGFVDFVSIGEAKRAMEALVHSTHLYGRRLVLEWAKEDETVDDLREKTAERFSGDKKQRTKQKQQIEAIESDLAKNDDDDEM